MEKKSCGGAIMLKPGKLDSEDITQVLPCHSLFFFLQNPPIPFLNIPKTILFILSLSLRMCRVGAKYDTVSMVAFCNLLIGLSSSLCSTKNNIWWYKVANFVRSISLSFFISFFLLHCSFFRQTQFSIFIYFGYLSSSEITLYN